MLGRIATPALAALIIVLTAGPSFAGTFDAISVPEPATMTLFGLAAGGAFLARKFFGRS